MSINTDFKMFNIGGKYFTSSKSIKNIVIIPYIKKDDSSPFSHIFLHNNDYDLFPISITYTKTKNPFIISKEIIKNIFDVDIDNIKRWNILGDISSTEIYNKNIYTFYAVNVTKKIKKEDENFYFFQNGEIPIQKIDILNILQSKNPLTHSAIIQMYRDFWIDVKEKSLLNKENDDIENNISNEHLYNGTKDKV